MIERRRVSEAASKATLPTTVPATSKISFTFLSHTTPLNLSYSECGYGVKDLSHFECRYIELQKPFNESTSIGGRTRRQKLKGFV
jgi:hypothetical protein